MLNRYDPDLHHRRSVRLRGHDYSQAGVYFLTICAVQRLCFFGEIVDNAMCLNDQGQIVEEEWRRTAEVRPNVALDAFVVMPNHVHGILIIQDTPTACPYEGNRQFGGSIAGSVSAMVGQFKSIVTKRINRHYNTQGLKIWQANYYEHIIRDERELERVREYIVTNPARWFNDTLNDQRHES